MILASRKLSLLSCAAGCVLAGCCLTPKTPSACNACVPSAIAEVPNTYENYTPPQPALKPIPAPEVELPPSPDDQPAVPPPPMTQSAPNSQFDFFEPGSANRATSNTR